MSFVRNLKLMESPYLKLNTGKWCNKSSESQVCLLFSNWVKVLISELHPKIFKARSFSLLKYHLVKIFISIYTAPDNRRIVFSTVKWTTWNVYRFSPDRALGGFDPSSSDTQS